MNNEKFFFMYKMYSLLNLVFILFLFFSDKIFRVIIDEVVFRRI